MGWARFDDGYDSNPKMVTVGLAAQGVHVRAVCYARRHLTNGRVPSTWVAGQLAGDPGLTLKQRRAVLERLVEHNAFEKVEGGYLVHDFLDFQPSREAVESQRKEDRLRKDSGGNPNGKPPGSKRTPRGRASRALLGAPVQSQSLTTEEEPNGSPSKREGSQAIDQDQLPDGLDDAVASRAGAVLEVLERVQAQRGGNKPTRRGVGLALAAFPDRDHHAVTHELEHWALAGSGQGKPVRDWVRTYRTFLKRSVAASPSKLVGIREAMNERARRTPEDRERDQKEAMAGYLERQEERRKLRETTA